MDAMILKMDALYIELQTHAKKTKPDLDKDDIPMSQEEEAKFMQTFRKTRFYNDCRNRDSNHWRSNEHSSYNRDNYRSNTDDKPYDLQKQFNDFMKSQQSTNAFVKETFMDLKTQLETVAKNHQASIQNLETKFDRLADKQSGRPSGSLTSNTQPNPKAHNSKAYQPPQSRNEHVNAVFIRSGKSYNPLVNPNDQQNDSETPINFDSDDEDDELTPQTKTQNPKSVKETLLPKPYKPKISYPQRLRKEKMEAQYGKFLDMIRSVRINVPLIDVLARMPNYGKFLKELIRNKHKIEQIFVAFLSDESSAMIQNKVPPKLGDPGSFLIPCNFNKTFSCNALADLGASINLMPYSLYAKLSLETLKPTKMSVRLADRSFQYPVGIAENTLIEVGKFIFPADFVILEMEEYSKVPLILGRPFLHTADASDFAVGAVLGKKDGKNFHSIYFASKTLNPAQQKYTVIEKELMAVVFAFDKFRSYLILSKTIVHTDHSALRNLFKKQDAKPRLIRWILLLQEFDIEIKDRKGTKNVAADHLSRIKNDETSNDSEVDDNFPGETLKEINTKDEPWFADFANYLVDAVYLDQKLEPFWINVTTDQPVDIMDTT
ncbi:reverse transcriptase domain-containing protein [Tanacetum coccineum]